MAYLNLTTRSIIAILFAVFIIFFILFYNFAYIKDKSKISFLIEVQNNLLVTDEESGDKNNQLYSQSDIVGFNTLFLKEFNNSTAVKQVNQSIAQITNQSISGSALRYTEISFINMSQAEVMNYSKEYVNKLNKYFMKHIERNWIDQNNNLKFVEKRNNEVKDILLKVSQSNARFDDFKSIINLIEEKYKIEIIHNFFNNNKGAPIYVIQDATIEFSEVTWSPKEIFIIILFLFLYLINVFLIYFKKIINNSKSYVFYFS